MLLKGTGGREDSCLLRELRAHQMEFQSIYGPKNHPGRCLGCTQSAGLCWGLGVCTLYPHNGCQLPCHFIVKEWYIKIAPEHGKAAFVFFLVQYLNRFTYGRVLLFCCCAEVSWPRDLIEERVPLGSWFQEGKSPSWKQVAVMVARKLRLHIFLLTHRTQSKLGVAQAFESSKPTSSDIFQGGHIP